MNDGASSLTMNSRDEREVRVKQEGMRPSEWSSHKNPRIVRVSRSFGGKDRHSKVRTVRGLRDRRIRLSVPTAIQIYDLQHRLGLSQPSKAVDWLLDNTKSDIDKLPPLPIIPGSFIDSPAAADQTQVVSSFLTSNHPYMKEMNDQRRGKDKWIHQDNLENLFPLGNVNQSSFPSMPYYNPYFHWDLPNLSLSHIGGPYPFPEIQSRNFYPTATTIPPIIPSFPSKSLHPHQNDTATSGKED